LSSNLNHTDIIKKLLELQLLLEQCLPIHRLIFDHTKETKYALGHHLDGKYQQKLSFSQSKFDQNNIQWVPPFCV